MPACLIWEYNTCMYARKYSAATHMSLFTMQPQLLLAGRWSMHGTSISSSPMSTRCLTEAGIVDFITLQSKVRHPRWHHMTATPCGIGDISLSMQHEMRDRSLWLALCKIGNSTLTAVRICGRRLNLYLPWLSRSHHVSATVSRHTPCLLMQAFIQLHVLVSVDMSVQLQAWYSMSVLS